MHRWAQSSYQFSCSSKYWPPFIFNEVRVRARIASISGTLFVCHRFLLHKLSRRMIDGNNFRAFGKLILCRCVHYREWSRANAPHSQRWCWNCGRKQDVNKQEKKTTNLTRTRHTVAKGTIHFEPLLFGMRRAHKRKMVFFVSLLKANGHKTQKRTENLIKKLLHTNRAPVDSSPRFSLGRLFEEGKKTTPPEESAAKAHVPYFYIQAACRRIPIRSREHGCAHTLPRTTCRARVNCWEAPQGCQKRGSTFIQRKCLECIL